METSKKKLIFLDVDGVLNTATVNGLKDELIQNLANLLKQNGEGCCVVFSSTWRYGGSERSVVEALVSCRDVRKRDAVMISC